MNFKTFIKKYTMVIALVVVFIFFAFLTGGRTLMAQNVSNLVLQNAYVLVMACGMLLCILTGGNVDLSVGSTLCLSAALSAKLLSVGAPAPVAILASIALGSVIGVWQGYLIGYVHIPPFICTLGGMFLFRGFARVILDSRTIAVSNQAFLNLFGSYINIPGLDTQNHCVSALIIGIVVAVGLVLATILRRAN
ncbi:MAG: sugar ABC transporter permease, partial [Lachnospiraceae bacterium]|nr:sugar ABC transporter permease [Lachnospiraceae bacterium]